MPIFSELRNRRLIRELCCELNKDVLLFGFDGFVYFGNLQSVEESRLAILTPAAEAESNEVEILTPGGEVIHVDFTRVDLWQLVGKGTGIVSDPIQSGGFTSSRPDGKKTKKTRHESPCLIRQLRRMIGDEITLTTLGGFLFEGTLAEVPDELAILRIQDIFVPGSSSSLSNSSVRSAVINLRAITSVSSISCCSDSESSPLC
ncbi:Hypothetical protein LUCI_0417 [Lucifera butyrica]|uniref:Uncharacterized protein n=1 Tax=Lucifera butyrica TaxID=1351585 RepID=A0A498R352_9FIRM|nr:hypothetical protein [Lucifera butyrica]VBB05210.1 Hypothetical protein LUCI_0417 [Lucifera butyrica]